MHRERTMQKFGGALEVSITLSAAGAGSQHNQNWPNARYFWATTECCEPMIECAYSFKVVLREDVVLKRGLDRS